ncbi:Holo-[acyl-carrier-protein] synthase [Geodia barretti]|uniref:L-aminoadipate-semialdehyde dehydrogenase-phosphopantetheinyl transferase n=1 Tax=Geodia barretti TaxID=519541 RepID=A0AA35R9T9_GEOBA|nr:Holo-[acyl-carrier-protein] synthase [Geodia barretti]
MLVTGVDIIEIERVKRVYAHYGERFLRRIYTDAEAAYCRGRAPQLASRFAAKEAVMKLLGTGVRGVRWRDIEVVRGQGAGAFDTAERHGDGARGAYRID